MSDPSYWVSLRQAGLFIYLALFCLFLGIAVFLFFFDRLVDLPLWNSAVWLRLRVPVIAFGVIAFFVALLTYIHNEGRQELEAARAYAQSTGWAFSFQDTEGLHERMQGVLSEYRVDLNRIRTVETGERQVYLFDCSYRHERNPTAPGPLREPPVSFRPADFSPIPSR